MTPMVGNATQLMYVLANLIIGITIICTLARSAAQNQSIAGWGHVFPSMLMDLLPIWAILYAAPVFVANALNVGLGAGSYIAGATMIGPSEMAGAFTGMIHTLLAAPFNTNAPPVSGWQAFAIDPGRMILSYIMFGVSLLLSLMLLVVAIACVFTLLFVEVDCLVVMPITLLLVPFIANRMTSGLWQGALSTYMRRIMRLVSATVVAGFAIAMFGRFAAMISAVNPLDYHGFVYNEFTMVLGVSVIGAMTAALPFALDAAISGQLGVTGIDVGRQVFAPAGRALYAAGKARAATVKSKGGKAA